MKKTNTLKTFYNFILAIFSMTFLCSFNYAPITYSLESYKNALEISQQKLNRVAIGETRDLVYPATNTSLKYDLHYPLDYMKKKYPVFIWIHGGSWTSGHKSDPYDVSISKSIAELGYVVASIDYTLVIPGKPATAFPQAMNDVEKFVAFASDNLKEINADWNTPINIGGASAGAHLAVCQAVSRQSRLPFRCVVDAFGPVDFTEKRLTPLSYKIMNNALTANDSVTPSRQAKEQFSPLYKISDIKADAVLVLHSTKDTLVPFEQARSLERSLVANKVTVITNYILSNSRNLAEADHDYPTNILIENIQSFLSSEICRNKMISLSCTQNVIKGGKINCLVHANNSQIKKFHWIVNGKILENSERLLGNSWINVGPGVYTAQIAGINNAGQNVYSNFVKVEVLP